MDRSGFKKLGDVINCSKKNTIILQENEIINKWKIATSNTRRLNDNEIDFTEKFWRMVDTKKQGSGDSRTGWWNLFIYNGVSREQRPKGGVAYI